MEGEGVGSAWRGSAFLQQSPPQKAEPPVNKQTPVKNITFHILRMRAAINSEGTEREKAKCLNLKSNLSILMLCAVLILPDRGFSGQTRV